MPRRARDGRRVCENKVAILEDRDLAQGILDEKPLKRVNGFMNPVAASFGTPSWRCRRLVEVRAFVAAMMEHVAAA
jgi:hypothetical protein